METNPTESARGDRTRRAYVGCRTTLDRGARGKAIEVFDLRADDHWIHTHSVIAGANPSYLVMNDDETRLHCVHGDGSTVSSFAVRADGGLDLLGERQTEGRNPVHLTFSPDGRWVLIANYASGSIVSLPVQADGSLGEVRDRLQLPDQPGPHRQQQKGAHPHQVKFDPSGRWLLVPDKGGDAVHTLAVNSHTGCMHVVASLSTAPGGGPRHLAMRDDSAVGWLVLELTSQVLAFAFDSATGVLRPNQRLMTVPESFTDENTGAGIAYLPESGVVCVSNRGHGSVATFHADPSTGALAPSSFSNVAGRTPRFLIGLSDHSVCVANEDADSIVVVDLSRPHSVSTVARTGSPVCVAFTKGKT